MVALVRRDQRAFGFGMYREGRAPDWVKVKCLQTQEFVVAGFTKPEGKRKGFGALVLGYYDSQHEFCYAGRVGTGFSQETLADLHENLLQSTTSDAPFSSIPDKERRSVKWVDPEMVVQVEFIGWTGDGHLRHPTFRGLRRDKLPSEVVLAPGDEQSAQPEASRAESGLGDLRLTNPNKVLFPEQGLTKFALAEYYAEIADWILPHVVNRPLSLVRGPDGRQKECFYQKRPMAGMPQAVRTAEINVGGNVETVLYIADLAGLLSLVQFGVLEIHTWGARIDRPNQPDRIVLDLDPDPDLPWGRVVDAATELREILSDLGLRSFLKTSGGKGLHIVLPISRRTKWVDVKEFSKTVAQRLADGDPNRYTLSPSKAARVGRIYLDYLRNTDGATTVAAYSTRAREGAPVSVPVAWEELPTLRAANLYTVGNVRQRLAALEADPWADIEAARQSINAAVKKKLRI